MARRGAAAAKVGRAARAKEEMPLPGGRVSSWPQLTRTGRRHAEKVAHMIKTYLLNILTDDRERSVTGVERDRLNLGRTFAE